MSDIKDLETAIADYNKAVEEKTEKVNAAVASIATIRQVQTEKPDR